MKATAIAHPNIALIKYWGKRDRVLNLPAVPSLSITLAPFETTTTVDWGQAEDSFEINGELATGQAGARIAAFLDLIDPARPPVHLSSSNNFPTAAGLASSSSAFAALALAATAAAGQAPSITELSILARQGSGSACRSLWGGWVTWAAGQATDGTDSHGTPLAPPQHWDLRVVVALVSGEKKATSSRAGMVHTEATSPLYSGWVCSAEADLREAVEAVQQRDLERLGTIMEHSTMKMHGTMLSAQPAVRYLKAGSMAVLDAVEQLRGEGVPAWATLDAGPNVKVLTTAAAAARVQSALDSIVSTTHLLHIGADARLLP
jgi:diphosphomevalonate decarboxylase